MRTDDAVKPLWGPVHGEYQAAKARLDLVASAATNVAAASAHQFFAANILAAPPFTPRSSVVTAGEHAKKGPGPVARELTNQVEMFTAVARNDLVGRHRPGALPDPSPGRHTGRWPYRSSAAQSWTRFRWT